MHARIAATRDLQPGGLHKMKKAILAAIAALALTTPAFAQAGPPPTPAEYAHDYALTRLGISAARCDRVLGGSTFMGAARAAMVDDYRLAAVNEWSEGIVAAITDEDVADLRQYDADMLAEVCSDSVRDRLRDYQRTLNTLDLQRAH